MSGSPQGYIFDAPPPYLLRLGQPPTQYPQRWGGETLPWFIHVFQPLTLCVTWYLVHFLPICVRVFMLASVFTCAQMRYMYVHMSMEAGENLNCHPQEHHLSFLKLILSLAWNSSVRSGWQLASPQNPPVSIPQYWGCKIVTSGLVFLHAFWRSNTGPCPYMASVLWVELSVLLLDTDP